jgi:zinc finger protein-like protein
MPCVFVQIYHCPYCNLCRRGAGLGLDACHCMQCNCCMHLTEFAHHKCRDLSTCPVCTEYLFDSNLPYRVRIRICFDMMRLA